MADDVAMPSREISQFGDLVSSTLVAILGTDLVDPDGYAMSDSDPEPADSGCGHVRR
jgi:hypothetical protein